MRCYILASREQPLPVWELPGGGVPPEKQKLPVRVFLSSFHPRSTKRRPQMARHHQTFFTWPTRLPAPQIGRVMARWEAPRTQCDDLATLIALLPSDAKHRRLSAGSVSFD